MTSPTSVNVVAGEDILAAEYNNLRADMLKSGFCWMTNNSGGSVAEGDVVVFDKTGAYYFTTSAILGDKRVFGVALQTIANGAQGWIARRGNWRVNVNAAVTIGQALICSGTVKLAMPSGGAIQDGYIGFVTDATGSPTYCMAELNPQTTRTGGAVTFSLGNKGSFAGAAGTVTVNTGFAISGTNKLVVLVVFSSTTSGTEAHTAATCGGVAMTKVGEAAPVATELMSMWYILAPADATVSFTLTCSGSTQSIATYALLFNDVNQSVPEISWTPATGNSNSPAVSGTTTPGDFVLGGLEQNGATTVSGRGAGQTQLDSEALTSCVGFLDKVDPATGLTQTLSWTMSGSAQWGSLGMSIHPL